MNTDMGIETETETETGKSSGKAKQLLRSLFRSNSGGGKIMPAVFLLIAAAAAALILLKPQSGDVSGSAKSEGDTAQTADTESERAYISDMERELEEILSRISGAGTVSVHIYVSATNEKILAENTKTSSDVTRSGDNEERESESRESEPLTGGGSYYSSNGEPYVIQEKLPCPSGIIIVASGAENEKVKNEIYEAVKALYGLSANRIKITY